MFSRLAFGIAAIALGVASAASSYKVTLNGTFSIGSTELKAGEYSVQVQGDKAVFKNGKTVIEVPATAAKSEKKYFRTLVVTEGSTLQEIDFGGTTESIVFNANGGNAGGTK